MHKTVVSSEVLLTFILKRAKEIIKNGAQLFASPSFLLFLKNDYSVKDFEKNPSLLDHFADLDDYDILGAIKVWQKHDDKVLSQLSERLINRRLFKIEIAKTPFTRDRIAMEREMAKSNNQLAENDIDYFVFTDKLTNNAYNERKEVIKLLLKDGSTVDISKASDNLNISALSKPVEKYFLCYGV